MEKWKDIKGYEGIYQVSDLGRVKRLESKRYAGNGSYAKVKERILKPRITKNGYVVAGLCGKTFNVHRLVLETFSPIDEKLDTMHLNNNRIDNRLDNLRWGTRKENIQQMVREGRNKGFHTGHGTMKYI